MIHFETEFSFHVHYLKILGYEGNPAVTVPFPWKWGGGDKQ